jgi:beta-phosphoglucomutase-like phosphatase (HAD superfamily)
LRVEFAKYEVHILIVVHEEGSQMGKTFDALQELDLRINSKNVLFFDMDGTLVDTNYANYLSYKKAIQHVLQSNIKISYNPSERFNREVLKRVIPNLTKAEYEKIIQLKNEFYIEYMSETKLNDLLADILKKYFETNKTILVTDCREDRAFMTLTYHGLINKFSRKFYKQKTHNEEKNNKYEYALISLKIPPTSVVVFENEKSGINAAILAGINYRNIISIYM